MPGPNAGPRQPARLIWLGPEPKSSYPGAISTLQNVADGQRKAETDAILAALDRTRWNRKQAAAILHIDYKALLYKLKKLGIDRQTFDASAEGAGHSGDYPAS